MLRFFVFGAALVLVFLPVLLILFAPDAAIARRIRWAVAAFLAPIAVIALVQLMPLLTNNSAVAARWERFFGLVLMAGGFFLPWVIFALFLHGKARA